MLGCNSDVTVWNKWRDPASGRDVFIRHVLPVKCKFKSNIGRSVTGNTANVASSFAAVVPWTEDYRPESVWKGMDEVCRGRYFTIQKGDIMALGTHETEITGVKPYTESMVKAGLLPDVFSVKAYAENARSARGRHIRVEGV